MCVREGGCGCELEGREKQLAGRRGALPLPHVVVGIVQCVRTLSVMYIQLSMLQEGNETAV